MISAYLDAGANAKWQEKFSKVVHADTVRHPNG
jgi:hypothetical protein